MKTASSLLVQVLDGNGEAVCVRRWMKTAFSLVVQVLDGNGEAVGVRCWMKTAFSLSGIGWKRGSRLCEVLDENG